MEDYYHFYVDDKFLCNKDTLGFEIDFDENKKELVRVRRENVIESFFAPYKTYMEFFSGDQDCAKVRQNFTIKIIKLSLNHFYFQSIFL